MRPFKRLSADMRLISSSESVKSNTLKLSAMRSGLDERGIGMTFYWIDQRSATCATLRPSSFAISASTASLNSRPRPSGQ